MYGCDCHIGCLSGSVTRVGKGLSGNVIRLGSTESYNELSGSVTRVGTGLRGYASLVCSTNKDAYLRVVPDVVWLTPDMLSGEFDIYSNVVWRID